MAVRRTTFLCVLAAGAALGVTLGGTVFAAGTIYSCIGKKGEKITQDYPIAECADKDQLEHNFDGSRKSAGRGSPRDPELR